MSRILDSNFTNREIDYDKLLSYGFKMDNNRYIYTKKICDDTFLVEVNISNKEKYSKVIDLSLNEEYILVDTNSTSGYIKEVKEEYDKVINDIIDKCTINNMFNGSISKEVLKYIKDKYGDKEEYLWEKFPETAAIRNKKNNKWYAVLMVIEESKLGIDSNNKVEVIDLKCHKERIQNIIDNKQIFPGYHMNKSSWITIKLDGSMKLKEIYKLIDISYNISLEK